MGRLDKLAEPALLADLSDIDKRRSECNTQVSPSWSAKPPCQELSSTAHRFGSYHMHGGLLRMGAENSGVKLRLEI